MKVTSIENNNAVRKNSSDKNNAVRILVAHCQSNNSRVATICRDLAELYSVERVTSVKFDAFDAGNGCKVACFADVLELVGNTLDRRLRDKAFDCIKAGKKGVVCEVYSGVVDSLRSLYADYNKDVLFLPDVFLAWRDAAREGTRLERIGAWEKAEKSVKKRYSLQTIIRFCEGNMTQFKEASGLSEKNEARKDVIDFLTSFDSDFYGGRIGSVVNRLLLHTTQIFRLDKGLPSLIEACQEELLDNAARYEPLVKQEATEAEARRKEAEKKASDAEKKASDAEKKASDAEKEAAK